MCLMISINYEMEKGCLPKPWYGKLIVSVDIRKNIQPHDLVLLQHEHLEHEYMHKHNLDYELAHVKTNETYHYIQLIKEHKEKGLKW